MTRRHARGACRRLRLVGVDVADCASGGQDALDASHEAGCVHALAQLKG